MGLINQFIFFAMMVFTFARVEAMSDNEKQLSYYIRIPAAGKSCAEEAESLALRFKQITKIENVGASCKAVNKIKNDQKEFQIFSIAVTYFSEHPVQFYTAKFSEVDSVWGPNGVEGLFEKYEDCLRAMPAQVASYEVNTELPALISTCELGSYSHSTKYILRIDGIGKPKIGLRAFALPRHYVFDSEFVMKIKNMFVNSGLELVMEKEKSFFYYAEWPLAVQQVSLGYFSNPELCQRQIGEAISILESSGSDISDVSCLPFDNFGEKEEIEPLSLVAFQVGGKYISESYMDKSNVYYSFEECLGDKGRVYTEYRNRRGKDPLGAICKDSDGMYRMTVFENR